MADKTNKTIHISDALWDLWCIASIVGIWPRFIEPNLLCATRLTLKIPNLPDSLQGLKILQLSDLHLNPRVSNSFLNKLISKARGLAPDIIVFTGDFLCYSKLQDETRLLNFLNSFHAPFGCYAVFGNHDYAESVSINDNGDYDILRNDTSMIKRGLSRLMTTTVLTKQVTKHAKSIGTHQGLTALLAKTPFTLIDNETRQIPIKGSKLNICGLGEYMIGKTLPEQAFRNYDPNYPGIVLLHNPDGVPLLRSCPGDVVLCGHTHGGQVNLPWVWKKFTLLENLQFKKGLLRFQNKWVYISRGLGGVMQFRWFAMPEIVQLTMEKGP